MEVLYVCKSVGVKYTVIPYYMLITVLTVLFFLYSNFCYFCQ